MSILDNESELLESFVIEHPDLSIFFRLFAVNMIYRMDSDGNITNVMGRSDDLSMLTFPWTMGYICKKSSDPNFYYQTQSILVNSAIFIDGRTNIKMIEYCNLAKYDFDRIKTNATIVISTMAMKHAAKEHPKECMTALTAFQELILPLEKEGLTITRIDDGFSIGYMNKYIYT